MISFTRCKYKNIKWGVNNVSLCAIEYNAGRKLMQALDNYDAPGWETHNTYHIMISRYIAMKQKKVVSIVKQSIYLCELRISYHQQRSLWWSLEGSQSGDNHTATNRRMHFTVGNFLILLWTKTLRLVTRWWGSRTTICMCSGIVKLTIERHDSRLPTGSSRFRTEPHVAWCWVEQLEVHHAKVTK
jgi:hypothetical protein